MVVSLGPGKFYGSSLPRPRYYTDIKLNSKRVDPPVSVLDPLLSWAQEAHWSMGGLSFKRVRMQGRIEGNVEKLRKEQERSLKIKGSKDQITTPDSGFRKKSLKSSGGVKGRSNVVGDSPPPAPISKKRRARSMWIDEDDDEEEDDTVSSESEDEKMEGGGEVMRKRRLVRKLAGDFEMVASRGGSETVSSRTRSRRVMVLPEEEEEREEGSGNGRKARSVRKGADSPNGKKGSGSPVSGSRSSPRLKQKSS